MAGVRLNTLIRYIGRVESATNRQPFNSLTACLSSPIFAYDDRATTLIQETILFRRKYLTPNNIGPISAKEITIVISSGSQNAERSTSIIISQLCNLLGSSCVLKTYNVVNKHKANKT